MMFENNEVEVIKDGQIMRMPRAQADEEDLFILNRPGMEESSSQNSSEVLDLTVVKSSSKDLEKEKIMNSLVDNFHWKIVRVRREKSMTRKQFAEKVGESEEVMKKIEYGELPVGNFILISKVEEVLGIRLRKESSNGFNVARKLLEGETRLAREREKRIEPKKEEIDTESLLGEEIEIID